MDQVGSVHVCVSVCVCVCVFVCVLKEREYPSVH